MATSIEKQVVYTLSIYAHVIKAKEAISQSELVARIRNSYKSSAILEDNIKALGYIKGKVIERNLFGRIIVH